MNTLQGYGNGTKTILLMGDQNSTTQVANGTYELDFSSYIPNDGYVYNVHGAIIGMISDISAIDRTATLSSTDKLKIYCVFNADGVGGKNMAKCVTYTVQLPSNSRKLNLILGASNNTSQWQYMNIQLHWYQKMGVN